MTSLIVHVKWMSAAVIVERLSVSDGRRLSPALMDAINDVNLFLMTSSSLCFHQLRTQTKPALATHRRRQRSVWAQDLWMDSDKLGNFPTMPCLCVTPADE